MGLKSSSNRKFGVPKLDGNQESRMTTAMFLVKTIVSMFRYLTFVTLWLDSQTNFSLEEIISLKRNSKSAITTDAFVMVSWQTNFSLEWEQDETYSFTLGFLWQRWTPKNVENVDYDLDPNFSTDEIPNFFRYSGSWFTLGVRFEWIEDTNTTNE